MDRVFEDKQMVRLGQQVLEEVWGDQVRAQGRAKQLGAAKITAAAPRTASFGTRYAAE